MKMLVFSDSHGDRQTMVLAAEAPPVAIFHLGDCWRDAEELGMPFPTPRSTRCPAAATGGRRTCPMSSWSAWTESSLCSATAIRSA